MRYWLALALALVSMLMLVLIQKKMTNENVDTGTEHF
jgi:heme exporter protein D